MAYYKVLRRAFLLVFLFCNQEKKRVLVLHGKIAV